MNKNFFTSTTFKTMGYKAAVFGSALFVLAVMQTTLLARLSLFGAGGGMVRDCLIGAVPVAALVNEIYLLICIVSGFAVFFCYKKISETTVDGLKKHSSSKALAIITGIVSLLAFIPMICKRDNNNDGVADLVQKSQSAYEKTNSNCSKIIDGVSCVSELAQLIS